MGVVVYTSHAQCSLVFACAGVTDPIVTTFGVLAQAKTAQEVADGVRLAAAGTGKWLHPSNYSNQYTFLRTDVVKSVADEETYATAVSGDVGQMTAVAPVPVNCAVLVRKNTALGGRTHKGRFFLPPAFMTEADVSAAGVISGTSFTSLQTKLNTFRTDLIAADLPMRLLHSDPAQQPAEITSLTVMPLLATQRRRMR